MISNVLTPLADLGDVLPLKSAKYHGAGAVETVTFSPVPSEPELEYQS